MTFHFVMTVQIPGHGGLQVATFSGTHTPSAGQTRNDVYKDVYNSLVEKIGTAKLNVMFFSLEPNKLPVA